MPESEGIRSWLHVRRFDAVLILCAAVFAFVSFRLAFVVDPPHWPQEPGTFYTDEVWDILGALNRDRGQIIDDPRFADSVHALYPLRSALTSLEFRLFGPGVDALRIPSLAFGWLFVFVALAMIRRHVRRETGRLFALIVLTCIPLLLYLSYGRHYGLYLLPALLLLWGVTREEVGPRFAALLGAGSALLGGAAFTNLPMGLALAGVFAARAILPIGRKVGFPALAAFSAGFACVGAGLWFGWYGSHMEAIRYNVGYTSVSGAEEIGFWRRILFTFGSLPGYGSAPVVYGLALLGALVCWRRGNDDRLHRLCRGAGIWVALVYMMVLLSIRPRYLIYLWPGLLPLLANGLRFLAAALRSEARVDIRVLCALAWGFSGLLGYAAYEARIGLAAGAAAGLFAAFHGLAHSERARRLRFVLVMATLIAAHLAHTAAALATVERANSGHWRVLTEELPRRLERARVVAIDNPDLLPWVVGSGAAILWIPFEAKARSPFLIAESRPDVSHAVELFAIGVEAAEPGEGWRLEWTETLRTKRHRGMCLRVWSR